MAQQQVRPFFRYYCKKYCKNLTRQEREDHRCFKKKRGKNKGKPCNCLQKLPVDDWQR